MYKESLSSPFNVAGIYISLGLAHLGLDDLTRCPEHKKTDSPLLSSHWLPVSLHLGAGLCDPPPPPSTLACRLILSLCTSPNFWDFLGSACVTCLEYTIHKTPCSLTFTVFLHPLRQLFWALGGGVGLWCVTWRWVPRVPYSLPFDQFWISVIFATCCK